MADPVRDLTGRCLCGAVTFHARGAPNWVRHCCCESCRRAAGATPVTFASFDDTALSLTGEIAEHASSPEVRRGFCPRCGSALYYRTSRRPGETDLHAALLDDPEAVSPEGFDFPEERPRWLNPLPEVTPKPKARSGDAPDA